MKKIGIIIAVIVVIICIGVGTYATNSDSDPIITLSYFDKKIGEFREDIINIISEMINEEGGKTTENSGGNKYEIVNVVKGKKVIFNESTEFIIRRGEATVIDPSNSNGIPNLTTGNDDKNGEKVGLQKLYLVPRSDGRGILAKSDLIIMIRGSYTIK